MFIIAEDFLVYLSPRNLAVSQYISIDLVH